MVKPIKIAFIGCGGHSKRHAEVLRSLPGVYEIVGAMDTDRSLAESFINEYGSRGVATEHITELFGVSELHAVVIGSPHKFHLSQARLAVEKGVNVLCEKPLWEGPYREEAAQVIDEAKERGLVFSSCHLRRYEQEYLHIQRHLPSYIQKFGKPIEMRFQFFYHEPRDGWKRNDSLLLDHMNHEIDLLHFLFGHSPASFWRLSHSFDGYRVAGKTESDLAVWFSGYRRLKAGKFRNELEIIFESGRVRSESVLVSKTGLVSSSVTSRSFEDDSEDIETFPPHRYSDALVRVMDNFAMAIRGGSKSYLSRDDLITNTSICNDLLISDRGSV